AKRHKGIRTFGSLPPPLASKFYQSDGKRGSFLQVHPFHASLIQKNCLSRRCRDRGSCYGDKCVILLGLSQNSAGELATGLHMSHLFWRLRRSPGALEALPLIAGPGAKWLSLLHLGELLG